MVKKQKCGVSVNTMLMAVLALELIKLKIQADRSDISLAELKLHIIDAALRVWKCLDDPKYLGLSFIEAERGLFSKGEKG